jgi:hypothetical protein
MRGLFTTKSLQQSVAALALVTVFGVSSAFGGAGTQSAAFDPAVSQQAVAADLSVQTGLKIEVLSYSP